MQIQMTGWAMFWLMLLIMFIIGEVVDSIKDRRLNKTIRKIYEDWSKNSKGTLNINLGKHNKDNDEAKE